MCICRVPAVHAVATTGSDTCTPCTETNNRDKNMCASPGDGQCQCCHGFYLPPGDGEQCKAWPRGVEVGATLAGLEAKKKFFRVNKESDDFYRCPGGAKACTTPARMTAKQATGSENRVSINPCSVKNKWTPTLTSAACCELW